MSVEVYVNFNGDCREAVNYYSEVFKTKTPKFMTFEDAPQDPNFKLPEASKNLIMHVELEIEGSTVMFSDTLPGSPATIGDNISLSVSTNDIGKIKSFFEHLKTDGRVVMDLQKTFWSKCYGSVVDKFGIVWQFNHVDHS